MPPALNGPYVEIQHASYQYVLFLHHHFSYPNFVFSSFLKDCQGIVMTTDPCCNKAGIDAIEDWMTSGNLPRKVYSIGPQLPAIVSASPAKSDLSQSPQAQEIVTFLDTKLDSHGERSVVYVRSIRVTDNCIQ
jgi:hypothetical protein